MLDKSQDILRLSFAAAALLIGGSVAYHYAIYIPEKDEEVKAEAAAKVAADERHEEEQAKQTEKTALEKRAGYRICVSNAVADYHARWESSCKAISQEAANNRSNCLARGYYDANTCTSMYPATAAENCRLPGALANSYDSDLRDEKQRCLAEVNNGLASPL
jgi:hypothetical protein